MSLVTLPDVVTFTRDRLRESSANAWTELQVVRAINEMLNEASRRIKKEHPTYLEDSATITYVADQATYDLPANFWGLLSYPLRTDLSPDAPIGFVPFPQYHRHLGLSSGWFSYNRETYTFQGPEGNQKLRITPVPAEATGTLGLHYIRRPPALTSGTSKAGDGTTMTLADTPTYGVNDVRDDYYNGAVFLCSAGSAVGESAECTDFDGGTAVLTIDFTSAPSMDSVYSVLPPWGEEFNYLLSYGAAASLLDDLQIPHNYQGKADRWLQLMLSTLERSQAPKYHTVTDHDRYL